MRKIFTHKCGLALVLLLLAFVQGGWAADVTPVIHVGNAPDAVIGTQGYHRPSVSITADGKMVRQYFRLSYSFEGASSTRTDDDGNQVLVDIKTGTTLNPKNGVIIIGDKTGEVKVKVSAKVITTAANKYNDPEPVTYTFNVTAPDKFVFSIQRDGATLTGDDGLSLVTATVDNKLQSTELILSAPKITYTVNNIEFDVTDDFDITASASSLLNITPNSSTKGYTVTSNATANGTDQYISFTYKPKEGAENKYGSTAYTLTEKVKTTYLTSDNKIQTFLVFDKNEMTKYKFDKKNNVRVWAPTYKIVDADGNDYTPYYAFANSYITVENAFKYSKDPFDQGQDLRTKDGKSLSILSTQQYPNLTKEHTDGLTFWGPQNGQVGQPDDYVVSFKFTLHNPDGIGALLADTATIDPNKNIKVAGMFYSTNEENSYDISRSQFVLHVLKRAPSITLDPDPSTTPIAHNYVMTSFNRFEVSANFVDSVSDYSQGEKDCLVYGNGGTVDGEWRAGFKYYYFVPDFLAWKSETAEDSIAEENSLKEGQVKVQVTGNLKNEDQKLEGLDVAIPQYERDADGIYKTDANGNLIPVMGTKPDGTPYQKMEVVTGNIYESHYQWNNDAGNWSIIFHGRGHLPMFYTVISWTKEQWDVGSMSAKMFNIVNVEPVYLVIDPTEFTIPVGQTAKAPSAKVVDQFWYKSNGTNPNGRDLSKYYKLQNTQTYKDQNIWQAITTNWGNYINFDTELEWVNSKYVATEKYHSATGKQQGTVDIQISPVKETQEDSLKNWKNEFNPNLFKDKPENAPGKYTIKVVGNSDDLAQYDIIYDANYYDSKNDGNGLPEPLLSQRDKSKMGKLHFIKNGKFYQGTTSEDEAPGLTITFGTGNDDNTDPWTVETGTTKTDGSFDTETGQPCVMKAANVTFGDYDSPSPANNYTPTAGGFLKLVPVTNGFLTIDGYFGKKSSDIKYYLLDMNDDYYTQTAVRPTTDADGSTIADDTEYFGESSFAFPLMEGHTYYLWCSQNDNGFWIHGLLYKPAFVVMRQDTEPATSATIFRGSEFHGDMPALVHNDERPNVTFTRTYGKKTKDGEKDEWSGSDSEFDNILKIVDGHDLAAVGTTTYGQRVRARAAVLGKKTTDGKQIQRNPYIDIAIVALPMYKPTPDEIIYIGKRVTTTNFVTRMWMTWGGWNHDDTDYPYYANNNPYDKNKSPEANWLADEWNDVKSDTVGMNNRTIDGFKYQSTGANNPYDENVISWHKQAKKGTFGLPVRGTYVKFEPEESGTLMVYILQNGMTDMSDDRPGYKVDNRLRRRALYIVDEAGNNVDMPAGPDVNRWGNFSNYLDNANPQSNNKNYVAEALLRCSFKSRDEKGNITDAPLEFNNGKTGDFQGYADADDDMKQITDNWGTLNAPVNVIKLKDGGFVVPTKAYIRYTFDVKAGKTYYVFCNGSKIGCAGFAFVPEGFMKNSEKWPLCTAPAEGEEYDPSVDAAKRANLPDPTDEAVYSQSSETVGHAKIDLKQTGTNTIDEKTPATANVNFVDVTLDRKFTPNQWTSICLPFSLSEHQVKQIFGTNSQVIVFDSVMTKHVAYTDFMKTDTAHVEARTAHFTQHVNQLMEAGRPYFIKPTFKIVDDDDNETDPSSDIVTKDNDGNVTNIVFKHVSLEAVNPMDIICNNDSAIKDSLYADSMLTKLPEGTLSAEQEATYKNMKKSKAIFTYAFKGIYDRTQIPWYSYVMGTTTENGETKNGLYRIVPKSGSYLTAEKPYLRGFRAYLYPYKDYDGQMLQTTDETKAKLSDFWITGAEVYGDASNGTATGIDQLVTDMNTMLTTGRKGVYNLQGQMIRMNNDLNGLPAGVYIMNGKKYLIK